MIKDFLPEHANSKTDLLTKLVTKVREIIRYLNSTSNGVRPYKVYTAILDQSGIGAPVATVLENTLGATPVWTRNGTGDYTATSAGVFKAGKTMVIPPVDPFGISNDHVSHYAVGSDDENTIFLLSSDIDVVAQTNAAKDSILAGAGYSIIEVRVYN